MEGDETMAYVISTLLNSVQLLSFLWFFDGFFVRKYQGIRFWVIALMWDAAVCFLLNIEASVLSPVKVISVIASILLLSVLLYVGDLAFKVFLSVSVYALFNLLAYVLEFAVMATYGIPREMLVNDWVLYTVTGFVGGLCMLVLSQFVKHFHSPGQYNENNRVWTLITTVFPIASILVLLLLYAAVSPYNDNQRTTKQFALVCLCVLAIANIIVLVLIDTLKRNTQEHEELVAISERERMQRESVLALSAAYDGQRRFTHDFRKHISVLTELMEKRRYDEATHYIEQLQEQQTERILLVNTHHATIDAILNQKGYEAEKNKIDIRFEVNDLSRIHIKATECTVVLGNLLDNAIESCQKFPEDKRWIQVSVIYNKGDDKEPGNIFISVLNPSLPVKIENNMIRTTKANPSFHGFGLKNVKDILDRYHAEYYMSYEDGQFVFSLEWPDENL